uniref:glutathione peroxidase 7-like isoform X1 n=1 Tax=Styela clava TaxID=7725 RepID=UPI001939E5FC|nr:glutathione peroxidase 7-like isoform X1 [Styela clava]
MVSCLYAECFLLAVFFPLLQVGAKNKGGLYSFDVRDIHNQVTSLEQYRGKISLVVNVASECGYTDEHYRHLTEIYNELTIEKNEPFTVLAFPCNQFGNQEPDNNEEILKFAQTNYAATFPIFGKTNVAGRNPDPIYGYIKDSFHSEPTWNFWKYLIDEKGAVINGWGPRVTVKDIKENIVGAIKKLKTKSHGEL